MCLFSRYALSLFLSFSLSLSRSLSLSLSRLSLAHRSLGVRLSLGLSVSPSFCPVIYFCVIRLSLPLSHPHNCFFQFASFPPSLSLSYSSTLTPPHQLARPSR